MRLQPAVRQWLESYFPAGPLAQGHASFEHFALIALECAIAYLGGYRPPPRSLGRATATATASAALLPSIRQEQRFTAAGRKDAVLAIQH